MGQSRRARVLDGGVGAVSSRILLSTGVRRWSKQRQRDGDKAFAVVSSFNAMPVFLLGDVLTRCGDGGSVAK